MDLIKRLILRLYPFLIACYPILALRNYNILYVDLASIFRTLLIVILLTALIWVLLNVLIFRDPDRSGVATSLAMILILSYGHIFIQWEKLLGEQIRHSVLVVALGGIFLLGTWLAVRRESTLEIVRNFLAAVGIILILMTTFQSLYYEFGAYQLARALSGEQNPSRTASSSSRPDIYLIVLDAHGRADVLHEKYGYDSTPFLQELKDLGFYVAACSQSNYASTNLSITSLLQMEYFPPVQSDTAKLPPLKESAVMRTLDANGYTVITFENRTGGHFDLGEDVRLAHNQLAFGELNLTGGLNEFEKIMFHTSATRFLLDTEILPGFNANSLTRFEDYEHYQQTHFILSKMQEVPELKSPKFVLVHLLVPHSPFIFTPDGSFRFPEDTSPNGYRDNTEFIDHSILVSIRGIINRSEQPPVILLMGDHGPPPGRVASREDRLTILNAYYVNDETKMKLYDSVTPVNSFRLILNEYFGTDYPLLEDTSYSAYKLKQLGDADVIENTCTASAE